MGGLAATWGRGGGGAGVVLGFQGKKKNGGEKCKTEESEKEDEKDAIENKRRRGHTGGGAILGGAPWGMGGRTFGDMVLVMSIPWISGREFAGGGLDFWPWTSE